MCAGNSRIGRRVSYGKKRQSTAIPTRRILLFSLKSFEGLRSNYALRPTLKRHTKNVNQADEYVCIMYVCFFRVDQD